MTDELVKKQDVIDAIHYYIESGYKYDIFQELKNLPSVELKERTAKVSNQIFNSTKPYTIGAWIGTCECGELVSYSSKYCHMCGAKLDWSRNE